MCSLLKANILAKSPSASPFLFAFISSSEFWHYLSLVSLIINLTPRLKYEGLKIEPDGNLSGFWM